MTEEEKPYTFEEYAFIGTGTFSGAFVGFAFLGLLFAAIGIANIVPIAKTVVAST